MSEGEFLKYNPFISTDPYLGRVTGFISLFLAVCNLGLLLTVTWTSYSKKRWFSIFPCFLF